MVKFLNILTRCCYLSFLYDKRWLVLLHYWYKKLDFSVYFIVILLISFQPLVKYLHMKRLEFFNKDSLLIIDFNKNISQSVQGLSKWAYAAAMATAVVFLKHLKRQRRRKVKYYI